MTVAFSSVIGTAEIHCLSNILVDATPYAKQLFNLYTQEQRGLQLNLSDEKAESRKYRETVPLGNG
jgi:hypothetical protein